MYEWFMSYFSCDKKDNTPHDRYAEFAKYDRSACNV